MNQDRTEKNGKSHMVRLHDTEGAGNPTKNQVWHNVPISPRQRLLRRSLSPPGLTHGPAGLDSCTVPSRTQCELLRSIRRSERAAAARRWRRRPAWSPSRINRVEVAIVRDSPGPEVLSFPHSRMLSLAIVNVDC